MFRRLGTLLAALALFTVAGGHWAVLQSIAWAQMLHDYSKDAPVAVAITKTFGGQYPCAMCRHIAQAQKEESPRPEMLKADKKTENFVAAESAPLRPPRASAFAYFSNSPGFFPSRSDAPPTPVPLAVS